MTHNQIEYAKLVESRRHNTATEQQAVNELKNEYAKLAETIRNNDLNYDINNSKLAQAYAQLDEQTRHNIAEEANTLKRIAEEARHNGVSESTTLQELAEKARNNNLTYRSKLLGNITDLATKGGILSTLGVGQLATALQLELEVMLGQSSIEQSVTKTWTVDDNASNKTKVTTGTKSGEVPISRPSNATKVNGFSNTKSESTRGESYKKKYENEIPEDFSSSKGPSSTNSKVSTIIISPKANDASVKITSGSEHGKTSGGTNYSSSGGIKSSGTIYSGSMSSGPGVGL